MRTRQTEKLEPSKDELKKEDEKGEEVQRMWPKSLPMGKSLRLLRRLGETRELKCLKRAASVEGHCYLRCVTLCQGTCDQTTV
eukprot:5086298-Amphidinium_carterae.1